MMLAEIFVAALGAYLALGFVFAIAFAARGASRIDPDAEAGTLGFRLLILPGATLLWPPLLRRWIRGTPPPLENTPHKRSLAAGDAR